MQLYYYTLLWFATNFIKDSRTQPTTVINTTLGPVRGEILKTISKGLEYSSFKGIRYGKPPIGHLRFKPPNFADPWTEVVNATVKGSDCTQIDRVGLLMGDEDCLFVNVFSPVTDLSKTPRKLKAVMVWIHGGAFSISSSDPEHYGPDFLIENDVVVVSFNYRLGPLGFLALNHPDAMGNAGLKDQLLLLKWVRQNIDKFHGDPTRVTIVGDSAGAASILYHTLSDQSQGLFHNVITISGSPFNPWAFINSSKAEKNAIELSNLLGENTNDKDKLLGIFYNVSAYDLVWNALKMGCVEVPFGPVLEDLSISPNSTAFLTTCIVKKYESGNFSKVPYIMGFMDEEILSFTGEPWISEVKNMSKTFASMTNSSFAIPSVYRVPDGEWFRPFVKETTDLLFKAGIEIAQRYVTAHSRQPLYYYSFTFESMNYSVHESFGVSDIGAGHCDILGFIWQMPNNPIPLDPKNPISILKEKVSRMFTNFAKYGNPTPIGEDDPLLNIKWPDYGLSQIYLDIGDDLSLGKINCNENTQAIIEASAPFLATIEDCSIY